MNAGSEYEPEVPLSASYFRCTSESVNTWVCFPLQRRVIFGIEVEPPSFLPAMVLIRSWVRELCSFDLLSSQPQESKLLGKSSPSAGEHAARLDHQYMCITFSHSRCAFAKGCEPSTELPLKTSTGTTALYSTGFPRWPILKSCKKATHLAKSPTFARVSQVTP